jgi:hypothetical protein
MGTIHCPCGRTFSDGAIPCPHEWTLISEGDLFAALDEIEQLDWKAEFAGDKADWSIRSRSSIAYRCPHCERMLVFEDGIDKRATSYRRE